MRRLLSWFYSLFRTRKTIITIRGRNSGGLAFPVEFAEKVSTFLAGKDK